MLRLLSRIARSWDTLQPLFRFVCIPIMMLEIAIPTSESLLMCDNVEAFAATASQPGRNERTLKWASVNTKSRDVL